jgi:hypothetical protein
MKSQISVRCQNCRTQFKFESDDLDVQQVGADNRGMETEIFYQGHLVSNCPECEVEFEVEYEVSEYPIGIENYFEFSTTGVDIIEAPRFMEFTSQDYSYHDRWYYDEIPDPDLDTSPSKLILPEHGIINARLNEGVAELILEIQKRNELIYEIDPRKFEELIAHVFRNHGFAVDLTKRTRDGGQDIIAMRYDLGIPCKYIIECKKYAPKNKVGVELVRSLAGVQATIGANKAVLATTSTFTKEAKKFASTIHTSQIYLDLKDYNDVMRWIMPLN